MELLLEIAALVLEQVVKKAASAEVCLCEISWQVELLLKIAALVQEQQSVEKLLVLRSACVKSAGG